MFFSTVVSLSQRKREREREKERERERERRGHLRRTGRFLYLMQHAVRIFHNFTKFMNECGKETDEKTFYDQITIN